MNTYPDAVVQAYAKLCKAITEGAITPEGRSLRSGSCRSRGAYKAAHTKASKEFSRACYAAGYTDAQAVANELSRSTV